MHACVSATAVSSTQGGWATVQKPVRGGLRSWTLSVATPRQRSDGDWRLVAELFWDRTTSATDWLHISTLPSFSSRCKLPEKPAPATSIVGVWSPSGGGAVTVTANSDGTYSGVVNSVIGLQSTCDHPVGEQMWQITGSWPHYTGTHLGFGPASCDDRHQFPSVWDLTINPDGTTSMHFCATVTTAENRQDCSDYSARSARLVIARAGQGVVAGRLSMSLVVRKWDRPFFERGEREVTMNRILRLAALVIVAALAIPLVAAGASSARDAKTIVFAQSSGDPRRSTLSSASTSPLPRSRTI